MILYQMFDVLNLVTFQSYKYTLMIYYAEFELKILFLAIINKFKLKFRSLKKKKKDTPYFEHRYFNKN